MTRMQGVARRPSGQLLPRSAPGAPPHLPPATTNRPSTGLRRYRRAAGLMQQRPASRPGEVAAGRVRVTELLALLPLACTDRGYSAAEPGRTQTPASGGEEAGSASPSPRRLTRTPCAGYWPIPRRMPRARPRRAIMHVLWVGSAWQTAASHAVSTHSRGCKCVLVLASPRCPPAWSLAYSDENGKTRQARNFASPRLKGPRWNASAVWSCTRWSGT
jgi:hypothetical protein